MARGRSRPFSQLTSIKPRRFRREFPNSADGRPRRMAASPSPASLCRRADTVAALKAPPERILPKVAGSSSIARPSAMASITATGWCASSMTAASAATQRRGSRNWAMLASLIEPANCTGVDPEAYLSDVLTKLGSSSTTGPRADSRN
jgi:hypothetical protein